MLQGPYANSSVSSLSLDQSNQSYSPNDKITPVVLVTARSDLCLICVEWLQAALMRLLVF